MVFEVVVIISVTGVEDTRAIGRIELYSKHKEPQVVRTERVLNTHCGLPRLLAR
jgi:hypothetical protein